MPLTGAIGLADAAGFEVAVADALATGVADFLYPAGHTGLVPETVKTLLPLTHLIVAAWAGAVKTGIRRVKVREKISAEIANPDMFFNLRTLQY